MPVTDGGPNHGTWYLSGVGFDVQLASAFNPDYFAAGTTRPQGCGPVEALSFWDYNLSACANNPGGWDDLWTAFAHDHEQIHVSNGLSVVTEPGAWYRYNLPTSLESWVESGANQLESRVGERVQRSGRCLTAAVSSHQWHGFPNFPIWFWQGSEFLRWQPGQSRVGTPLNLALNEIDPNLNCDAP